MDLNLAKQALLTLDSASEFYNVVGECISKYNNSAASIGKIKSSECAANIFRKLYDGDIYDVEKSYVLLLNRSLEVIDTALISVGGIYECVMDPKIIFRKALICKATSIIICHNHPSGNPLPSDADKIMTKKVQEAGNLLTIDLMDHVILAGSKYFSFAEEGLI